MADLQHVGNLLDGLLTLVFRHAADFHAEGDAADRLALDRNVAGTDRIYAGS
eukprot:gene3445-4300_t